MNSFNSLYVEEPNDPPKYWNSRQLADHLKSRTFNSKTITVVSTIIGRLNHHAIDNSDVEVHSSDFPVESNS